MSTPTKGSQGRGRGGLVPGGMALLAGIGCLFAAGLTIDESARHWHVPLALVAGAAACFTVATVQARRAKRGAPAVAARPVSRRALRPLLVVCGVALAVFGGFAGYGGYLLHQRDTGPHVSVTVTHCDLVDPGVQRGTGPHDYCYGNWTYEGRTYTGKYVQGARLDDEGHVLDCTLHGDTAYSRDLQTPLILLVVFGGVALCSAGLGLATWRQWRRAPATT